MPRNDSGYGGSTDEKGTGFSVGRRSYLKVAGVAVGSAGLFSGTASAAEHRGLRFRTVVDMVDDAGCDPTGAEPCDERITDAAADYTLLKFPAGTYKITEKNPLLDYTNLGFLGEGDVKFRVPENFNEKLLVVDRGTGVLFEGIDIDQTAAGATPGLHFGADDDLEVHDVEYIGQGIHPNSDPRGEGSGNPTVTNAFSPIVRSSDGTGTVTNVVAKNNGLMGGYNAGNGRIGVWVGASNRGTITLENCQFEGFPNNGLYCSRTYGVVQVEGGAFRNNDVTQVRLGSEGSYVEGATIGVDMAASDSPNPGDMLNGRGVRFEAGSLDTAGPEVRDCDIAIANAPHSGGGVVASGDIGTFDVHDTRIRVDADGVRGVLAKDPTGGAYTTDPPYDGTLRNVSVVGSADENAAIELRQRSGSVVEGCCIQTDRNSRNGIALVDSDNCVVRDSTVNTTGQPIVRENATADVDISTDGTCPVPGVAQSGSDAPDGTAVLTIEGAPASAYELSVSESLEKDTTMEDTTIDDNDDIDGTAATGQVNGGRDSYAFSGDITRLVLDGEGANLYYNGEAIDTTEYLPNTITIEGETYAEYEIETSDGIVKSAAMDVTTIDNNDGIDGTTATGQVNGGRDSYAFPGEVTRLDIDGDATVYRNGEEVDSEQFGSSVLTIEGAPASAYELSVSESLEKDTTMDDTTIDDNDDIDGTTATGQVNGGRDSYAFSGDITRLVLDGEGANLYYNGESVDPAEHLPNTLTIEAAPSAQYELATTDGIVKSTVMDDTTTDDNDDISGTTATGQVNGGRDSYALVGDITRLVLDGGANLYYNGESIDPAEYLPNTITIEGETHAEYEIETSDGIVKSTAMDVTTIDDNDDISGTTASGQVNGGRDSYAFPGEVTRLDIDGDATVYRNGEEIANPESVSAKRDALPTFGRLS